MDGVGWKIQQFSSETVVAASREKVSHEHTNVRTSRWGWRLSSRRGENKVHPAQGWPPRGASPDQLALLSDL